MPIWLIQLLIGALLSLAGTLVQQMLAPKGQEQKQARGFRGSIQTGGKVPMSFLVGTIGVPGKLEYRNTWGAAGGTPNAYLVDVISFGDLPIAAITGLFVNSEEVTIPETGHVTQGYPVPEKASGGVDHLWREFFDGSQTTANTYLNGKFGSDPDRPWLTDMIGRGIPYLTLTALLNEEVWPGFPSYMAVLQGLKLYDPRQDTTAGGSGSQRWANPSTWAFTDNNIVIVYNILRGIHDNTATVTTLGEHVWGGHARATQVPYADWAAAMDACDEDVDLDGGGTEKRFRAGREIFVNERPADVIRELLIGANARIAHSAGVYYVLVGVPAAGDGSLTDADVLVTQSTTLDQLPSLDDVVNGATASYLEPSQAWESKETAPYYRSDLEAEDDDRRQLEGFDLTTTFSGTQAQRILKAAVEEGRRFVRQVLPLRPAFGVYRPLEALEWTSDANGYTDKLFLITARTEDPWGRIILGFQEIDPTDHGWTAGTDEQPLSFAPMSPIRPAPIPMTGWAVAPYIFPDAGGVSRRIGIEVEFTGELQDVTAVRIQVREDFGAGNTVWDSGEQPYDKTEADPVTRAITWAGILPDTDYEVRGRFISPPASGRSNDWSAWLGVTTPDIGVTDADLGASLLAWKQAASLRIRDLGEELQLLSILAGNQDSQNFADRQYLLEQLSIGDGNVRAAYAKAILLAMGNDGTTIADAFEAVEAESGNVQAGVLARFTAMASPGGGWSRWGVMVRTSVAADWPSEASIFLEAKSDGSSRIVLKGGETNILDTSDNVLAAFGSDGGLTYARLPVIQSDKIDALAVTAAKLAAGAVVAGKISAGAIDAASLIVNGLIITAHHLANAIIVAGSATNTSDFGIGTSATLGSSVTIATDGGKVTVTAAFGYNASSDIHAWISIYKNGSPVSSESMATVLSGKRGENVLTYVDTSPGTTNNTYAVYGWGEASGLTHVFSSIVAENHKNA